MNFETIFKPFSELPSDADLTDKQKWGWGCTPDAQDGAYIAQYIEGTDEVIRYLLPPSILHIVKETAEHVRITERIATARKFADIGKSCSEAAVAVLEEEQRQHGNDLMYAIK